MILTTTIHTPLGPMLAAATNRKLCGLWFEDQRYYPNNRDDWRSDPDEPLFHLLAEQLAAYFSGRLSDFTIDLAPAGTPYRQAVWSLLQTIPAGTTITYGKLAQRLAGERATSARAVGGAVGRNPISIIIPCHRVIGASGALTGYAGGLTRKMKLLEVERLHLDELCYSEA
jgi:methylated-DNA-[protein]-cysteine S-methyltransferase